MTPEDKKLVDIFMKAQLVPEGRPFSENVLAGLKAVLASQSEKLSEHAMPARNWGDTVMLVPLEVAEEAVQKYYEKARQLNRELAGLRLDYDSMKAALQEDIGRLQSATAALSADEPVLLEAALSVMEEWDGGLDQQDGKEYENACKDWNDCLAALREWKRLRSIARTSATDDEEAERRREACIGANLPANWKP